jgi:tetratricopeptide (TPR) repeat protein
MNENATANNQLPFLFCITSVYRKRNLHLYTGLLIILMMGPVFVFAQTASSKNEALMAQADTLLGRQDYEGALPLLNKIIDKSKLASHDDYDALYKRAYCYYGLGRFENALSDINQYLTRIPNDQAKLLRAYINQELGYYEAQLEDLNSFITSSPGNPDLLRWRASVYMESEQYDAARKDITQLLQVDESPELKSYLGLIYYYQDKPDSALTVFEEVISKNPDYLQPYLYAASLTLEEEIYDLALRYIESGLKVEAGNLTLLFYKGIALVESDREEDGCRCLTKAFNAGMDDAGDYLKSYCYGGE